MIIIVHNTAILISVLIHKNYVFSCMSRFDQLLIKENDVSITRLIYFMSNTINIFAHTCLYCAIGEILMAQVSLAFSLIQYNAELIIILKRDFLNIFKCDRIYHAVFNQEWYILEPSEARDLIPVIIKSRKSVYLTAGKVFPITMATFCSVRYAKFRLKKFTYC